MVSHLPGVYLLSFCLTGLYDGSMPNLCSITSLGIPDISDICHVKASRFSQRKVMSASSYLGSRHVLTWNFFSGSLRSAGTSLSATSFFFRSADWSAGCWIDAEVPYAPFLADGGQGAQWFGWRWLERCVTAVRLYYLGRLFLGHFFAKSSNMHQCGVLTC
jgi:hypothetical protein